MVAVTASSSLGLLPTAAAAIAAAAASGAEIEQSDEEKWDHPTDPREEPKEQRRRIHILAAVRSRKICGRAGRHLEEAAKWAPPVLGVEHEETIRGHRTLDRRNVLLVASAQGRDVEELVLVWLPVRVVLPPVFPKLGYARGVEPTNGRAVQGYHVVVDRRSHALRPGLRGVAHSEITFTPGRAAASS